jgi:hypothetical protein
MEVIRLMCSRSRKQVIDDRRSTRDGRDGGSMTSGGYLFLAK